jgi:Mg2+-importing ATPase
VAEPAGSFWTTPVEEMFAALGSGPAGLASAEAAARRVRYGENRIDEGTRMHAVVDLLRRFLNPLILILLFAAAVAAATGDVASFVIIATMVIASVLLDFVQERRAMAAADALRETVALNADVWRDGVAVVLRATELVPGDVIALCAGDLVPADCRLLEAKNLFVNQAALTGESYPAEKSASGSGAGDVVPGNGAFKGSSVVSGTAKAIVVRTGRQTMLGGIAGALSREPPPTAFALGLREFGILIVRLTIVLVLFVLLINLLFHRPLLESFLFALALAVGLTPELLPMIVSVTLAHGAMRMAREQVIVKRLTSIHDLGSMDVLCSDKTGTLTQGAVALLRYVDIEGRESLAVREAAYLNAAFESGIRSPLDDAILKAAGAGVDGWTKLDEVPFDFERRRVAVLVEKAGQRRLLVKGAPEDILKLSNDCLAGDGPAPLDEIRRKSALAALERYGQDGFRVLGIASRAATAATAHTGDEGALTFLGFALFLDPPKESAGAAIAELAALGITVKVITGDNEHVTSHVCAALGLAGGDCLTGEEIATLSQDALMVRARTTNRFCRVTPSQKARIIAVLRRAGHVVGYMGDGINDAPSLHAADVGISVDGAVDVAKDAAAMILLRKDLGVLAKGVRGGRRTLANIMKYVMMGASSNFGNMFSMAGGVLFLPFLPMLPIQILLNNLLYDISEIAIPADRVDPEAIARPGRWDMRFVRNFMFVFGPLSSLFDFVTFFLLLRVFSTGEAEFHTGWFVESLLTQILVILVIRTRGSFFRSSPSPLLIASSLGTIAVALMLPYTPIGALLHFTPLPPLLLCVLTAITAVYLLAADFAKVLFLKSALAGRA